jgi:hypothetical protein
MKRGPRLNPGAILDGIDGGQRPDPATIARVLRELCDPNSPYDQTTLIKILARADSRESVPVIRQYFLTSDDPFVVYAALSALFRWWSEDPSGQVYAQRVHALAAGLDWDAEGLVSRAARAL